MRTTAILGLIAFSLASCTTTHTPTPEVRDPMREILGMWCQRVKGTDRCMEHMEIMMDGTVKTCTSLPDKQEQLKTTARYEISGRTTCFKITETNDPSFAPLGYKFCYELQEINETYFSFKLVDTGQIFTSYRLPHETHSCPPQ